MSEAGDFEARTSPPEVPAARSRASAGQTGRWSVAVLATLLLHGAAFFLFSVPVPRLTRETPIRPRFTWMGGDPSQVGSLLGEQLLLFDNAPLFLPTRWNASAAENAGSTSRSPAEVFEDFPARLSVSSVTSPEVLPVLPEKVSTPLEAAQGFRFNLFSVFGRAEREPVTLPARLARVEVRDAFSGVLVGTREVMADQAPGASQWPDWEPAEMLLDVDQAGWAAPLLMVKSSGSQTADAFFRTYVRQELRPQHLWGPGYFRISMGP